eukprot:2146106-Prymnesium_polylepis.1
MRSYKQVRPKPKKCSPVVRRRTLRILHAVASLYKQSRQGRVTDKRKEQVGSQPAASYAPKAVPAAKGQDVSHSSDVAASGATSGAGASSSACASSMSVSEAGESSLSSSEEVYRTGDVVFVKPISGGLWVAQLRSAIIKVAEIQNGKSRTFFNTDRVGCRYFVATMELESYPHAMSWWQERGAPLYLADQAMAEQRASACSAVHYSFEKLDRVTCSTVRGRVELLIDPQYHRNEVVSFGVDEE